MYLLNTTAQILTYGRINIENNLIKIERFISIFLRPKKLKQFSFFLLLISIVLNPKLAV